MLTYLLDSEFLKEMQRNMRRGIKDGRTEDDWKLRTGPDIDDRLAAIERHRQKYIQTKNAKHLAAVACNAMIVWWHAASK